MAIRSDSYGSVAEVVAFTPHLLDGATTYSETTRPTLTQVEKFIDRASGYLNTALRNAGITTPVTNSTGKLMLDDWVVMRATEYVELTQRGTGYSDQEGSRTAAFHNMYASACDFADEIALGLKELGVTVDRNKSAGLAFTGQTVRSDRADPDDSSLAQPLIRRGLYDAPGSGEMSSDEDEA